MPRSVSVGKNVAPPSSAYLPASSATPKRTAPCAVAASARASASGSRRQEKARVVMSGGLLDFGRRELCLESLQDGIEEAARAEADRVVGGEPGLGLRLGDGGPGALLVDEPRAHRHRDDARRTHWKRDPLVQLDELAKRRDRMVPLPALHLRPAR